MSAVEIASPAWHGATLAPRSLEATIQVAAGIVVDLDARLDAFGASGEALGGSALSQSGWDVCWLPRGRYRLSWTVPALQLPAGTRALRLSIHARREGERSEIASTPVERPADAGDGPLAGAWHLEALEGTPGIDTLAWRQGYSSWFFQHFDHASRTLVEYVSGDSPLLRGRVLDLGCGDGITALGVALRYHPRELVGVDPYRTYESLPSILARHGLGHLELPSNLRFLPEDANALPFDDDAFDAVISWAAVEHFAGGYVQALREVRRVLKPGGLLFIHPGLYYWNRGHHLAEYSDEPFFHLVKSREEIREMVFSAAPRYANRAGAVPTPEQHWQWFRELNHISVTSFEKELRALDFRPWRVALRTDPLVEYRPGMERYSFTDVAVGELYVSCFNGK